MCGIITFLKIFIYIYMAFKIRDYVLLVCEIFWMVLADWIVFLINLWWQLLFYNACFSMLCDADLFTFELELLFVFEFIFGVIVEYLHYGEGLFSFLFGGAWRTTRCFFPLGRQYALGLRHDWYDLSRCILIFIDEYFVFLWRQK